MFTKNVPWIALAAAVCLLASPIVLLGQPSNPPMRVGIYDSRAIAVTYARSDLFRQWLGKLKAERDQAKAAGDEKRVKEIEARGAAQQERFHYQAFATSSVADLMERIRPEIPAVAKAAGVVLIVSKWEVMYRDPAVEYVDVTLPLAQKFGADAKVLQMLDQLMKQPPLSVEELAGHSDH